MAQVSGIGNIYSQSPVYQRAIGIGRQRETALVGNIALADRGWRYGPGRQCAIAGRADYHWHVLLDPEPVRAQLTLPYRELVHRAGLAPVLAIWAHVTIEQLTPVTEVSDEERAQITALVRQDCAALEPFYLTTRRAEAWRNGSSAWFPRNSRCTNCGASPPQPAGKSLTADSARGPPWPTRIWPWPRSTFHVHATGWSRGLEVTGGGTGVVSHAGLVLRALLCASIGQCNTAPRLDGTTSTPAAQHRSSGWRKPR